MARRRRTQTGFAEGGDLFAPPETEPSQSIGADGHRARMRARLLAAGPDSLADYEMLEMVLFLALPRRDTKSIAKELLARFGSFAGTIAAPLQELLAVEGLGEAGAAALRTVQGAAIRLARSEVMHRPILANWEGLISYLTAALARERLEQVRVLFLDSRNRLIADEVTASGTVNHTPVYPREIMKRALELNATALVLVHNHPSGDPSPSREDIAMTQEMRLAAEALRLTIHDHLIIAGSRWISFRQQGLL